MRRRLIDEPWQHALRLQRSESRTVRWVGHTLTGAVGLAVSLGVAAALGVSITPLLLQLSVSGGATQGMAAQLYILGDALSLLFGQGAGPFGNVTTVVNMAALTRAMVGQGSAAERRNAWLIAQGALGLALSPLFVGGAGVSVAGAVVAVAAGAALSVWIAKSAAASAEPSYRTLLMGVAIGVAVAPMASKLALGQGLGRVVGEALEGPTIAAAALVLWDFWQSIQQARRSPASGQPELDLTPLTHDVALDIAWPKLSGTIVPPPMRPTLLGIKDVKGLADSCQAQIIDWLGDGAQPQMRERKQWLFFGEPGVGKRSTIEALASTYFPAAGVKADLLTVRPAEMLRVADSANEGGFLRSHLERAEYGYRKSGRLQIVALHNVDEFLAPDSEAGKTSAIDSSDLLDTLTCNHPSEVPPILIVGTTNKRPDELPKRLVERFTRRYGFELKDTKTARDILVLKFKEAVQSAHWPDKQPALQLRDYQLDAAAEAAIDEGLTGGDLQRYAQQLVSQVSDKMLSAAYAAKPEPLSADELMSRMHEREWKEFLLLFRAPQLSPRPRNPLGTR